MKFKISEAPIVYGDRQPVQQQQQPVQQQQQALPTYDPNTGLNIPAANLQDPNFVKKLNLFFKQSGIQLQIPIPKPQVQQQPVQQPMR